METRNETRLGTVGWMAVGATVLAAEVLLEESLTHAFRRGLDNPRYKPFLLAGMGITALHLTDLLPKPIDPFVALEAVGKAGLEVYRHL